MSFIKDLYFRASSFLFDELLFLFGSVLMSFFFFLGLGEGLRLYPYDSKLGSPGCAAFSAAG